jgi:hypothetical protein
MSREPRYPDDAPVDPPADAAAKAGEAGKPDSRRTKHIVAGAAIGIGSAALVAALLYANRARKSDRA